MESAELERTTVDIAAKVGGAHARPARHRPGGQVRRLPRSSTRKARTTTADDDEDASRLPAMSQGETLAKRAIDATSISPSRRRATPKPRWSSAWRSSASAGPRPMPRSCRCCKDRGYVRIDKKRLIPEDKGRVLTAFLESFFARYVEYDFTAGLEEQLDRISNNEIAWRELLRDFWRDFTAAVGDIKELRVAQVIDALDEMLGAAHLFPPRADGTDPRNCPNCENGRLSLKLGKFGGFIGCSNYPECRYTRQFSTGGNGAARRRHEEARRGSRRPASRSRCARPLRPLHPARRRREGEKPKRAGMPKGLAPDDIDLERALGAALAAARGRQASGGRRADPGRHRPLRSLRPARQDLRQPRHRRRRAHRRPQPRGRR